MSNLHPRPDSRLFEHLHSTTASLVGILRPLPKRARRGLRAQVNAMRPTIGRASRTVIGQGMRRQCPFTTPGACGRLA